MSVVFRPGGAQADARTVGGKAANLDRLLRHGFTVPPFFVVVTEAFRGARASAGTSTIPPRVREEVARALDATGLGASFVAVRSSAVGEDAAGESFAGVHDSFLYVRGLDAVLAAIARVWASATSERAMAYRASRNLPLDDVEIAVVVQAMVDADVSGVAFTADPTTGDVHRTVISSLFGLGEGLVSGGLDADTFTVEKRGGAIEARIAAKVERFVRDAAGTGGVRRELLPDELRTRASLTDDQVAMVARTAREIEGRYGAPQDIEFALDRSGTLHILQTRPITTVAELGPAAGHGLLWDNSNIIESFSGVTSPMTFSVIRRAYATVYRCFSEVMGIPDDVIRGSEALYQNMLGLIHGRVYYNLRSWYLLLRLFPGYEYNRQYMESMMGVKEGFEPEDSSATPGSRVLPGHESRVTSRRGPGVLRRYFVELPRLARLIARSLWNFLRIRSRVAAFEELFELHYRRWAAMDFGAMRAHELMATYGEMERDVLMQWRAPIINDLFVMVNYGVLKKLCASWCGDTTGSLQNDLICGEGGIRSTEPTFRLMAIARDVRANADLAAVVSRTPPAELARVTRDDPRFAVFNDAFARYLDEYGFRCMNELKLEEPTLRDRPEFAYQVIRNYVTSEQGADPGAITAREAEIRARAEARAGAMLPWLRRRVFWRILANARLGVKNRENMRFARTRIFGLVRELVRALGARLVEAGALERRDDVFFLTLDEAFDFVKGTAVTTRLRDLVALRRKEFDDYRAEPDPPDDRFETFGIVYSRNRFRARAAAAVPSDGTLRGIPCSPGTVTNTVKVILSPSDDAQLSGEILVAGRTDPGWVPLYPSVSGLLIERGSILSHSAIVAREMGIPTIVGIPGLTTTLKTGQLVTMDGSTGTVHVVADAAPAAKPVSAG